MSTDHPSTRRADPSRWLWAGLIFLVCSAVYYLTRSPALDEWDSVQFAMGIGEFDLWKNQPHAPGYPLYIAWGWLGERLLGLNAQDALALGSAAGGGLFVSGWFVLVARRFERPVAAISAAALATMAITWMSATKVITDPLATGLLTLALVWLDRVPAATGGSHRPRLRLAMGALAAAAAAGVRPQNIGILLLILVPAVVAEARRGELAPRRCWTWGLGTFLAGCLAWFVPLLITQARTPQSAGNPWAYGAQVLRQWRWRLDKPKVFVGSSGQSWDMVLFRLERHLVGWFTRGFGFSLDHALPWIGLSVIVAGWAMYLFAPRRAAAAGDEAARQKKFWRLHLPWETVYVLMIFCCLPGDQRYYLPLFPLFILAAAAGWWMCLPGGWRWMALLVPAVTLAATLPLVGPNHTEEPPTVRSLRWLQTRYPADERSGVWLILGDGLRHAQWYAPDFHVIPASAFGKMNPVETLARARAVYTDDVTVATVWDTLSKPAVPSPRVQHFERSPIIYRKHSEADLYQLNLPAAPAAANTR